MTDFSKAKKKKSKLGSPPSIDEVKGNLDLPEHAPNSASLKKKVGRPKSKRTQPFTTKLNPEFHKKLKLLAVNEGKDMGEIVEEAVSFWIKNKE
ncbi:conserved hypothetical protein [Bathymodiolus platifrons methanotrophic gill symbiont]|uniref:hypothetical protein n=1 Tax=Bathymodiolus platifrons methanotrophic gill symbiont TaxID=113268 RepID=UPI000B41F71C|nr:hypothetical protein [Bathymodiolus platifrons methanotrophic gill symbiont]GAW87738.1 conserved hypothetical protein [Bathymodiolus platifrons methanotrophic gill symbiont]GFO74349.1 hypothetical protein BPLS_P1011 [Bathymodiolus platifrons methanotrophic gill symbiont]GFO76491.1 hypothetical protein BPLS_P4302 [Bathymodiolus platifrons methanotrophic gill symbiont]